MADTLKLMAILAHPDDESLGFGGILAKCAAEHIETVLVTATLGERGWIGDEREYPGVAALGQLRAAELRAAAHILGIGSVNLLGYLDGDLDQADPAEVVAKIVTQLRRIRPHVVVTFGPDGCYGHPDHIAISQFTTAAIVEAANPNSLYSPDLAPHAVAKLYYMAPSSKMLEAYQFAFGELMMRIDDRERRAAGWPDWEITT
jgi:LmbE family N-acetylglucosaminyl deacetylase